MEVLGLEVSLSFFLLSAQLWFGSFFFCQSLDGFSLVGSCFWRLVLVLLFFVFRGIVCSCLLGFGYCCLFFLDFYSVVLAPHRW